MNCLVTINVNDVLTDNARASFVSASRRWGCDFLECRNTRNPELHPSFNKILVATELKRYNQVCCLDADMVVRGDTPSPFAYFPERSCFYGAPDLQPQTREFHEQIRQYIHLPYYREWESRLGMGVDWERFLANPINTGFMVYDPKIMAEFFDTLVACLPHRCSNSLVEQALINYLLLARYGERLRLLSNDWNYLNPPEQQGQLPMLAWIYHFTGWGYLAHKHRVKTCDWTMAPDEAASTPADSAADISAG